MGCVGDKGQPFGIGVQEIGKGLAGFVEQRFVIAYKETYRLGFELLAQDVLGFENKSRASSERAVVEEDRFRLKKPVRF